MSANPKELSLPEVKWVVQCKKGGTRTFEYFSELRAAIESGLVRADDIVISTDSGRQKAKNYAGTSDLFEPEGMQRRARLERARKQNQKVKKSLAFKKASQTLFRGLLAIGFAALVAGSAHYGPQAYNLWNQTKGESTIFTLVKQDQIQPASDLMDTLVKANALFRLQDDESLHQAKISFLQVLAAEKDQPDAVAGLAETLTELGRSNPLSPNIEHAKKLIAYGKATGSSSSQLLRAEARLSWRIGKIETAIAQMNALSPKFLNDEDAQFLLYQMHLDQKDINKATWHLSKAIDQDSENLKYLFALVSLFEQQGKYAQAASYLGRINEISPTEIQLAEQLGALYERAGDTQAAINVYRDAIRERAATETVYHRLIHLLSSKEDASQEIVSRSLDYLDKFPNGMHHLAIKQAYAASIDNASPPEDSKTVELSQTRRRRSLRRGRGRR